MGKRHKKHKKRDGGKVQVSTARITQEQRRELTALLRRLPGMVDIPEYCNGLTFHDAQWMIVELSFPRFRKVSEQWMVLGTVEAVRPGRVEVHRKDGTQTHVQVKSVSTPFKHMGRTMVHGAL